MSALQILRCAQDDSQGVRHPSLRVILSAAKDLSRPFAQQPQLTSPWDWWGITVRQEFQRR